MRGELLVPSEVVSQRKSSSLLELLFLSNEEVGRTQAIRDWSPQTRPAAHSLARL